MSYALTDSTMVTIQMQFHDFQQCLAIGLQSLLKRKRTLTNQDLRITMTLASTLKLQGNQIIDNYIVIDNYIILLIQPQTVTNGKYFRLHRLQFYLYRNENYTYN